MALLLALRAELRRVADPGKAPGMQAYMKSAMPYHGVPIPLFRRACRAVFAEVTFRSAAAWRRAVLALWRGARYREERYGAIELAGAKPFAGFQDMDALPMYEEMIASGAWWDYVDHVATRRLGELLRRHPKDMRRAMLAWSRDPNLWKRRSAILCQIGFKAGTDLELLYACIEPSLASKEFFLRKAIGWALRQYAWTNPGEVRRYVRKRKGELSGLSQREALKNTRK